MSDDDFDPAHIGLDGEQCTRMAPTTTVERAQGLLAGREPVGPFEQRLRDELMRVIDEASLFTPDHPYFPRLVDAAKEAPGEEVLDPDPQVVHQMKTLHVEGPWVIERSWLCTSVKRVAKTGGTDGRQS